MLNRKIVQAERKGKIMTIRIRQAKIEDAPILALAEQQIAKNPGELVSAPSELQPERFERTISSILSSKKGQCFVAEIDNRIVGHALLEPLHLNAICHVAHLTLVVHLGWQRQGIGTLLLQRLITWAKEESNTIEKIELHVRSTNHRAISLYTKMGFHHEGRLKNRVKIGEGQYVDDILMALLVKNIL